MQCSSFTVADVTDGKCGKAHDVCGGDPASASRFQQTLSLFGLTEHRSVTFSVMPLIH